LDLDAVSTLDSDFYPDPDAEAVPFTMPLSFPTEDDFVPRNPISPLDSPLLGAHRNNRRSLYFNPEAIQPANFNGNHLPEGYVAYPEYPVFKGLSVVKKAPSSVVVKQVNQLQIILGPQ